MSGTVLRMGIVADTSLQQHSLRKVIEEFGYKVVLSRLSTQLVNELNGDIKSSANVLAVYDTIDAWVVDVDLDGPQGELLDSWLADIAIPVILGDGSAPNPGAPEYSAWVRRLKDKIGALKGSINLEQHRVKKAQHIWVLGASTGGPKAVNEFLTALPPNLAAGFVYVQHIDAEFNETLAQVIVRGSGYSARTARHGDVIGAGSVAVIASGEFIEILENGTLAVRDREWPGPYQPSIDQVVANVSQTFAKRCGVIIFSGMGEDGAAGARLIKKQGGVVWTQSAETCACSSMPDSAVATGCVSYSGTPKALAKHLVQYTKTSVTPSPGARLVNTNDTR